MSRRTLGSLLLLAIVFLFVGLGCGDLAGGAAPGGPEAPPVVTEAPLSAPTLSYATPAETALPVPRVAPTAEPTSQPAILEARRLTLEWPSVMRAGDGDVIRLTLEVDEKGAITPTAEFEGHLTMGQTIQIPDVYATHEVVAEARLDLAGIVIEPSGMSSQRLQPGQSVIFYWSIRPEQPGRYRGVVWFYLRFVPLAGDQESEQAVAAFPLEIEAVSFLGLKAGPARILGVVAAFLSSILGVPFLEDGVRWFIKRLKS